MLSYVQDSFTLFHHSLPHKKQRQPYPNAKITYRGKSQYATADDNSQLLSPTGKIFILEVTGTFIYYACSIDATMLPSLGTLSNQQAAPKHHDICKTISRLCRNSPRRDHNVPRLRNGSISPKRRLLPLRIKIKKPVRRPFFHVEQLTHYCKQRIRRHHLPDHKISNVLRGGRGTGSYLRQLQGGHPSTSRPPVNGEQKASHADANQQHDRPRSGNQQYCKQTPQVHEHETALAPVHNFPKTISPLLVTRTQQLRRLRNKTPRGDPPQSGPWDLLDTKTQTGTFSNLKIQ